MTPFETRRRAWRMAARAVSALEDLEAMGEIVLEVCDALQMVRDLYRLAGSWAEAAEVEAAKSADDHDRARNWLR